MQPEPRDPSAADPTVGEPFDDEFDGEFDGELDGAGEPFAPEYSTPVTLPVIIPPQPLTQPVTPAGPPVLAPAEWWDSLRRRWGEMELRRSAFPWPRRRRVSTSRRIEVDYRDRISVATWMVVLGLGISVLLALPGVELGFWALGSPVSIPFTGTMLSAIFLAIMAAAGAESVVTVHPWLLARPRVRVRTWSFWALPMALTILSAVLLPLAASPVLQALGLVVSALLLASAYYGLYATVERGRPGFRRARFMLDALAYGSALLLFLFVYQTRTRSLLSGTVVAMTAVLLAAEILRTATDRSGTALTYGGIIGLVLGQVTWALNYWVLPGLTGGLLLLLIFYLLVGIAQQGIQGRLTKRVLAEFGVFGVVALVLIALVGPGFRIVP